MTHDSGVRLRRKPSARVVQHQGGVTAYPEPHAVPVLPPGWAPLDVTAQAAVLRASDLLPEGCRVRFASAWDPTTEYRVYCLASETWGGICAATVFTLDRGSERHGGEGRNTRLLAVADEPEQAVLVAIEFLNWDLEAAGSTFRLSVS